jgi:hypothetical protein
MKLKPASNQVAAIIVVVFQCQMVLGVIEERGEFRVRNVTGFEEDARVVVILGITPWGRLWVRLSEASPLVM